jgi:hypothetical protein
MSYLQLFNKKVVLEKLGTKGIQERLQWRFCNKQEV